MSIPLTPRSGRKAKAPTKQSDRKRSANLNIMLPPRGTIPNKGHRTKVRRNPERTNMQLYRWKTRFRLWGLMMYVMKMDGLLVT